MRVKKKILLIILLLFPLSAYATIITIAYGVRSGSAEANAYERSKNFDREKLERQYFDHLGLHLQYSMQGALCTLELNGAEGLLGASQVRWKRPSDAGADFVTEWPQGAQRVQLLLPLVGRWQLEFQGVYDGKLIRSRRDIFVPSSAP